MTENRYSTCTVLKSNSNEQRMIDFVEAFNSSYVLCLIEWVCTQALQVNVSIQIQTGLVEMRCKCVITSIHSTMSLIDKPNNLQATMPSLLPPVLQLLPLFLTAYSHLLCLPYLLNLVLLLFNKTIVSFLRVGYGAFWA